MDLNPPTGSEISIRRGDQGPLIIIPAKGSPARYFGGLFLLFWLGGWAFGAAWAAATLLLVARFGGVNATHGGQAVIGNVQTGGSRRRGVGGK